MANQWAHLEPFSDSTTNRVLGTVVRLLRAAGADAEASLVGELLAERRAPGAVAEDGRAREPDRAQPGGPSADLPGGPREVAARGHVCAPPAPDGEVVEFRDRDRDYLAWVAAHPAGYVINTSSVGRGNATLHRLPCVTITNPGNSRGSVAERRANIEKCS